jgi:hypothetical protein
MFMGLSPFHSYIAAHTTIYAAELALELKIKEVSILLQLYLHQDAERPPKRQRLGFEN